MRKVFLPKQRSYLSEPTDDREHYGETLLWVKHPSFSKLHIEPDTRVSWIDQDGNRFEGYDDLIDYVDGLYHGFQAGSERILYCQGKEIQVGISGTTTGCRCCTGALKDVEIDFSRLPKAR